MQSNEKERKRKVKEKAKFYFDNKLRAHVLLIPTGFRNGFFTSDLIDEQYYWFTDDRDQVKVRLFLSEIYDVEDYQEEREVKENE